MKYILQFGIILTVSFAGEALHALIPLPIPASIYGLVLMLACLMLKIIKLEQIEGAADFILSFMTLMFVPAAVGLIPAWPQLKSIALPAAVIILVTTALVMGAAGKTSDIVLNSRKRRNR